MLTRTTRTTDSRGHVVQVAVEVLNDAWEPLTTSYRDVGPFDSVDVILESLVRTARAHATLMMANDPSRRTPPEPAPLLPFS